MELSLEIYKGKEILRQSEESILNLIASNEKSLLDDQKLIENLIDIKKNDEIVKENIADSESQQ